MKVVKLVCLVALLSLSSCTFLYKANEFKGGVSLDLNFPFSLIGLDILPHIVLDFDAGFEWHSDEGQHRRQLELLSMQNELKGTVEDEKSLEELFAIAFANDGSPPDGELWDNNVGN